MGESEPLELRNAEGLRIAVVRSRYNDHITAGLLSGATNYLQESGADYVVFETPGAFELPLVCRELADSAYDAVVALGAVINGETDHYEHVAGRASEGLMKVSLETRKPISFGILTVQDEAHAISRSQPGTGNKGAEAAAAAVETALLMRDISRRS